MGERRTREAGLLHYTHWMRMIRYDLRLICVLLLGVLYVTLCGEVLVAGVTLIEWVVRPIA